jgi:hypothetical protein
MNKDLIPTKLSNLYASIIDQRKFCVLDSSGWEELWVLGVVGCGGFG